MIARRRLLFGSAGLAAAGVALATYGIAIEPALAPAVRHYAPVLPRWPEGFRLRIGVIADLHACEPWMPADRVYSIAVAMNLLEPDIVALLGDFSAGHPFVTGPVMPGAWGEALAVLRPPFGTFAVLGNHDWRHGPVPGMAGGPALIREALRDRGIALLENGALPIRKDGQTVWVAGLADQLAYWTSRGIVGADDLRGALAQVTSDDPILLLAHEPFVFPTVPHRVALTLSGHTHGGQVYLPIIGAPASPSQRYRYGHIVEDGRHMIVSGGLGDSGLPMRIGVPPEILCIDLGYQAGNLTA